MRGDIHIFEHKKSGSGKIKLVSVETAVELSRGVWKNVLVIGVRAKNIDIWYS